MRLPAIMFFIVLACSLSAQPVPVIKTNVHYKTVTIQMAGAKTMTASKIATPLPRQWFTYATNNGCLYQTNIYTHATRSVCPSTGFTKIYYAVLTGKGWNLETSTDLKNWIVMASNVTETLTFPQTNSPQFWRWQLTKE